MRSLFAKILLWFLATSAVIVIGSILITAVSITSSDNREGPFSRLVPFQLKEAQFAYETGGRNSLAAYIARVRAVFRSDAALTDGNGRDLLTGEDRAALIAISSQRRIPLPFFNRSRPVFASSSENGQYWFLLMPRRPGMGFWFFHSQQLWMIGVVILLCYALARNLTKPVRRLQKAVERFGQGDLSARAGSTRRDELGQLARTFDQMADRIQTLLAAERRLLLDISHELRSPLARLGVAVELARSGEDRDAALNRILKESERLNELVGELLQVTRAEGDPSSLQHGPVRLDHLLGELTNDCAIEAQARGCSLNFHTSGTVMLQGDPELLRRALENVLRNAIRHAPQKTPVEVDLEGTDKIARIRVRDYGPGVPEEALPRIFDPFYRVDTDRNRNSGGVGLGLSIARRAIELHKGQLKASNLHPGLLVEVELPLGKAA